MRADGKYSCVILDFGGVISHPQHPDFFLELGERLGVDPARLQEAYRRFRSDYDRGSVDGPQYWRAVLNRCGGAERPGTVDELIERDKTSWTVINQHVIESVKGLAHSGWRLAVLSNMPRDLGRAIRSEHPWLEQIFQVVTFSCEVGVIKPEPTIYTHTAQRMGVQRSACIFVDDTLENVTAARQVGMAAVQFTPDVDLERLLAQA